MRRLDPILETEPRSDSKVRQSIPLREYFLNLFVTDNKENHSKNVQTILGKSDTGSDHKSEGNINIASPCKSQDAIALDALVLGIGARETRNRLFCIAHKCQM